MKSKITFIGVTLLEVMLVLAVFAMILIMVLRQVQVFRFDAEAQQVRYNVDALFAALANYYKANCYGVSTSYNSLQPNGTLWGRVVDTIQQGNAQYPITGIYPMNFKLLKGFGKLNLVATSLVAEPETPNKGYYLQYNLVVTPRAINTYKNGYQTMAYIARWQAQVAIKLPEKHHKDALMYLGLLGGTCLGSSESSYNITCKSSNAENAEFIVWQRIPSLAISDNDNWLVNPTVDQFTQGYRVYPDLYLTNTGGNVPVATGQNPDTVLPIQVLYCGD